jgi:predicted amidohydrolase YtcJ
MWLKKILRLMGAPSRLRTLCALAVIGALGCVAHSQRAPNEMADLVLVGGVVVTRAEPHAVTDAVAIRDGRIAAVGNRVDELVGPATRVIKLNGAVALPGLVDAHAHIAGFGDALSSIDLRGTRSYAEVLERVRTAARERGDDWLLGRGWDQNDWQEKNFPTGADLERVAPGRKVWLRRIDGHAGLASPAALRAARVDRSAKDPEGGRILRDEKGEPTGVFIDNAMNLVDRAIPPPSQRWRERGIKAALARLSELGLTGVHDMGVPPDALSVLEKLASHGELPLRIYAVLSGDDPKLEDRYRRGPVSGEMLTIRAVKFFADGALGSRGAALLEPYTDDPENQGLLLTPAAELRARIDRAHAAGFQPCVHAIGDRANRLVLDAYENKSALRPRIEHAQVVAPEDIERFAKLGVVASMQPTHATSDMPWAPDRLGPKRLAGAYAWRTLQKSGAHLAFGSDFPVERPEVLEGLYAAMTRSDRSGQPPGGWRPEERLDFHQALAGFTNGAAYASFSETRRGRIETGFDADITVLDGGKALVELARSGSGDPAVLLKTRVVATIVAGRVVYARP